MCHTKESRQSLLYAPTRCNEGDSCAVLLAKISIKTVCLIAQEEFTRVCYADNPSHLERIAEMKRGIKRGGVPLDVEKRNGAFFRRDVHHTPAVLPDGLRRNAPWASIPGSRGPQVSRSGARWAS